MLGQVFGHFRVVERIGAGGMGVVYLGHDQHLDRPVALKVLPTPSPADAASRRRFRQEALALSRLNHPNIAVVHDFDTFDDLDLLVMEYVPGVTLSERLSAGPLPEPEVLSIGTQLAAGLEAAHAQGIVHRDLKPSNLRLMPEGRLKILDFGLARLFEVSDTATTQTGTDCGRLRGTLAYMAPELLRGHAPMPATDIYAAGITLYELATGSPPFSGSRARVIEQILNEQPQSINSGFRRISNGLETTILKAIDKRPDRRYQSAREFLVDLRRTAEPSPGAPPHPTRPVTRRRVLVAGAGLVVVGAAWWRFGPAVNVAAAFPPRGWVIIADFDNRTGDAQIDRMVQEGLLLALQQSSYVNVFSRERLFDALRRMRRPDDDRVPEAVALDVCRRENADLLLAGTIVQSGDAMRVTVRALDSAGNLLFAEVGELGRREEFFGNIDDLARRVRRSLGETLERIQQASEPLDKVTTQSYDALRLYTQAVDRIARSRLDEVPSLLRAALTLDPQFAMAHRQLARVLQTGGERQQSLIHLERAFELRDAVTARERYFIEAAFHGAHERYNDAVESLSLLAALYPDDLDAQYELAAARSSIGEVDQAIQSVREVLRTEPQSPKANELLVLLLARNSQEQEALDEARRAAVIVGDTPRLRWGRAMALMGLRRLAEASDDLRAMQKDTTAYHGISRLYLTRIALFEGRLDDASAELARDLEEDHRSGRASAELLRRYLLARLYLLRGGAGRAREQAAIIAAAPVGSVKATNLRQAAEVFLHAGDVPAARAILKRLESGAIETPSSFTRSCVHVVEGMLALTERAPQSALAAFRRADAEQRSYVAHRGIARAFELDRQWIEVAREWREVLDARGEVLRDGFPPDLVEAELELGHAYARLSHPAKARDCYLHVIEAWHRASGEKLARDANHALERLNTGRSHVR